MPLVKVRSFRTLNGHMRRCANLRVFAERKTKMRQAQADAKKDIDEYKSLREAKLRTVQPEVSTDSLRIASHNVDGNMIRPLLCRRKPLNSESPGSHGRRTLESQL